MAGDELGSGLNTSGLWRNDSFPGNTGNLSHARGVDSKDAKKGKV